MSCMVYAQDDPVFLTPPKVTVTEHYTLSNGLASNCVDQSFIDSRGRLWVNPCGDAAREFRLSFFQYDGIRSFFYEVRPDWITEEALAPILYILGENSNGFLFGADRENKFLFYWHPDTSEQGFFKLESGEVLLNMDSDENGEIFVLTLNQANQTYFVRSLRDESRERINIQLDFTGDFIPNTPSQFAYPFEVTADEVYFFHQRKGLVQFDRKLQKISYTPWSDYSNILPVLTNYLDVPVPRESATQI
ncbi:hypothetical protein, partial [Algoriphagus sp.]|uniref:hypothetical protein n=1 Tax=Algoriphagus sp. TaxID=1872435 RepID=UPI002600787B